MTDGTGAQYKNRHNFINLYMHQLDFGIVAEWHFHATAHGKGPYDGIGGTIKRKAARESLTRPLKNQITNAKQLFDWASSTNMNISFEYSTQEEHDIMALALEDRFHAAKTVKDTQK